MYRLRRHVYLDHNATTRPSRAVVARMDRVLRRDFGNPSSPHAVGRQAGAVVEAARADVAAALGCGPMDLVFTSGATEANNTVIQGLAKLCAPARRTIVSTPIEHASVMAPLRQWERSGGVVAWAPVDRQGRVDLARLEGLVDGDTFLVCCGLANNELGTLQDLAEVVRIAHRAGALVLSDAVQALGKLPLDLAALGVDYATFSAHKIHGPKGVGALYVRPGAPLEPLLLGGAQERGRRAGTESTHNLAGFGAACRELERHVGAAARVAALRDRLREGLRALKPDLVVNTPTLGALGNTLSVTLPGLDSARAIAMLDAHGIAVAAGSACHAASNAPSHVLTAIGLSDAEARSTLRLSLGRETRARDIRYALAVFAELLGQRGPAVGVVLPGQLDERLLFDPLTYVLDVRFPYDRTLLKSLPRAHEASFFRFERVAPQVPRDRHVIVVCQAGFNATVVAHALARRGLRNVSVLLGGMTGWALRQPVLYQAHAGRDVVSLSPG